MKCCSNCDYNSKKVNSRILCNNAAYAFSENVTRDPDHCCIYYTPKPILDRIKYFIRNLNLFK